jgi:hypothetical protein
VRAATLSVIVRLWSADGTGLLLRGEVEHVRTGERRFFATYGMLVDATNGSVRRTAIERGVQSTETEKGGNRIGLTLSAITVGWPVPAHHRSPRRRSYCLRLQARGWKNTLRSCPLWYSNRSA